MADPAEKSPIETLEAQIQENPEKVTAETIIDAYNKERKRIEGKPYSQDRKDALLKRLTEDQALLLSELKSLQESHDVQKSLALRRSRQMRVQMLMESLPDDPRHKSFDAARSWALDKSNPQKDENKIKDYEGTGVLDSYGRTRFLFSGYLAAVKRYDDANKTSNAELLNGLAEKAYADSFMDKSVDEKDLMLKLESFSMKQYIDALEQNGIPLQKDETGPSADKLSPEATGFFVGYLKLADLHFKDAGQAESYRQYLYNSIKEILKSGMTGYEYGVDPNFKKKDGEDSYDALYRSRVEQGQFQMRVFEKIKAPDEWQSGAKETEKKGVDAQSHHKKFIADASSVSKAVGFEYQDPTVKMMLAMNNNNVNFIHEPMLIISEALAGKEASAQFPGYMEKSLNRLVEVAARVQTVKEKNTSPNVKELTDMQTRLGAAQKQIEGLEIEENAPISTYAKYVSVMSVVNNEVESTNTRLNDIEKGVGPVETGTGTGAQPGEKVPTGSDQYEKDWDKSQPVDGRFKQTALVVSPNVSDAVYRNDKGAIGGKINGGAEVTLVDVNAKGKQINDTVFVKVKVQDKEVWMDQSQLELSKVPVISVGAKEGSPEVKEFEQFLVEHNLREFTEPGTGKIVYGLGEITDKPLNPDFPSVKSTGNYDVDRTLMAKYVGKKITEDEAKRLNYLLQQGVAASAMIFEKRPSLSDLQNAYNTQFVLTWEYIGKYEKIPQNGSTLPGQAPGGSPETTPVPPELGFLGNVYVPYIEALRAIVLHGNDPDGATFDLPINNEKLPCRLRYNAGSYELRYPGGVISYPNINAAANELNLGLVHRTLINNVVQNEDSYKDYEDLVGDLDDLDRREKQPFTYDLELDWNNPDPDIVVEVLPHGRISYTVKRENIGIYGEETRSGGADSFVSFMRQMGHLKKWAEGPKHTAIETAETKKEITWNAISDYRSFMNDDMQLRVGRVVNMNIEFNEVVQVYFDWGGGGDVKSPQNLMLNMWVAPDGSITYIMNGHGTDVPPHSKAANFAELVAKLQSERAKAFAGPTVSGTPKKGPSTDTDILNSVI